VFDLPISKKVRGASEENAFSENVFLKNNRRSAWKVPSGLTARAFTVAP
tara:strand:+ start:3527 stop:3673 length:147 start_codon:yes stop_codon:yes gene_type:complete